MLIDLPYDRVRAVQYATRWALSRNPLFTDFAGQGGDCTNFVSQCIFAGCGVMNDTPTYGWYYRSESDRAPAWTGVEALRDFLVGIPEFSIANGGVGPYAREVSSPSEILSGDVIQLADRSGDFYHTLFVSRVSRDGIFVSAHTNDALNRPLSDYSFSSARALHILGARIELQPESSFLRLLNGESL